MAHRLSGLTRLFIKVKFHNVRDLMDTRRELIPQARSPRDALARSPAPQQAAVYVSDHRKRRRRCRPPLPAPDAVVPPT